MAEPLIPDDARALYEELIDEGGRIIPEDDPQWLEPNVQTLLASGLAIRLSYKPPVLIPIGPRAAFAKAVTRWSGAIRSQKRRHDLAEDQLIGLHKIAVRATASREPDHRCSLVAGSYQVAALHDALASSAEKEAREFATGPYGQPLKLPTGEPHEASDSMSLYLRPEPVLFSEGGRYRLVIDDEMLDERFDVAAAGAADGEEYRLIAKKLPMKLLVIDDHTALVPLGPYGHPCLLIHDANLVALFTVFFELMWDKGTPWPPAENPIAERENHQRRRILDALAAGLKDEAIARQLGVSVRTVRRHITSLMKELGATTRFAAGVAAVRRGWLSPAA